MNSIVKYLLLCYLYMFVSSEISFTNKNFLAPYEELREGQTLVSENNRFELGFFYTSPQHSDVRYLGIWYKNIPVTPVWVANRENPLSYKNLRLKLYKDGNLILEDGVSNSVLVSVLRKEVNRPVLQLLNSGNLVIGDQNDYLNEGYAWESFDYPGDTLLPGMKLGMNFVSGLDRVMNSWRDKEDLSIGEFSLSLELKQAPQLVLESKEMKLYRWGPWNGQGFSGSESFRSNDLLVPTVINDITEVFFTYKVLDNSICLRLWLTPQGDLQFLVWENISQKWSPMLYPNTDRCDKYASCGSYSICYFEVENSVCKCLEGFIADSLVGYNGCSRNYPLNCNDNDGFVKYEGLKLPDNSTIWGKLNHEECEVKCLKECSCMAYTNINIYQNGSVCVVWLSNLNDIRNAPIGGDELYIRMGRQELERIAYVEKQKVWAIFIMLCASQIVGLFLICFYSRCTSSRRGESTTGDGESLGIANEDINCQKFQLRTLSSATNNFSLDNKIGQGGFGTVYKGILSNGEQIAVKRLSESSNQGNLEFKNEISTMRKLQHPNFIKLLGYCTGRAERMLVYEYMPNKSLDHFIYDEARKKVLTWEKRFRIIKGIANALVYLHNHSSRIIHRDLKTSNILLDDEMNPKISDLGLARSLTDQTEETSRRVIGTRGYMPPEYVMNGHYSTKSDVFSFGVVILESISGQNNWSFQHPDHDLDLLGHAWKLWSEGRSLELMDPELEEMYVASEVSRCVHVALLCVQTRPEGRPMMSSVISMLESEGGITDLPLEPGLNTRPLAMVASTSGVHDNHPSDNGE